MKPYKKVEITWLDTVGCMEWVLLEDTLKMKPTETKSVGYLIKSSRDKVIIAATYNSMGSYGDRNVIPRGCIKSVKVLE